MAVAHPGRRLGGNERGSAPPKITIVERRAARRYDLSLPLTLFPLSDRGIKQFRIDLPKAQTRDISTRGIYFTTDEPPATGSAVAFALILPAELTHDREVFFCAQGRVTRTEKMRENGIERTGVAAHIERYEIVKDDPLYHGSFGVRPESAWPVAAASL